MLRVGQGGLRVIRGGDVVDDRADDPDARPAPATTWPPPSAWDYALGTFACPSARQAWHQPVSIRACMTPVVYCQDSSTPRDGTCLWPALSTGHECSSLAHACSAWTVLSSPACPFRPAGRRGCRHAAVFGRGTHTHRPEATGVMHGLTSATNREDLARAVVEGLLCSLQDAVSDLEAETGVPTQRIMLIGGGAQSEALHRIAPQVFGVGASVPTTGAQSGAMRCSASGGLGARRQRGTAGVAGHRLQRLLRTPHDRTSTSATPSSVTGRKPGLSTPAAQTAAEESYI
jgi:hypothetical protein